MEIQYNYDTVPDLYLKLENQIEVFTAQFFYFSIRVKDEKAPLNVNLMPQLNNEYKFKLFYSKTNHHPNFLSC